MPLILVFTPVHPHLSQSTDALSNYEDWIKMCYCRLRRKELLDVFNNVKVACGDSATVTLASLTSYVHTLYTLIQLNGTDDNCTHGQFTAGSND